MVEAFVWKYKKKQQLHERALMLAVGTILLDFHKIFQSMDLALKGGA